MYLQIIFFRLMRYLRKKRKIIFNRDLVEVMRQNKCMQSVTSISSKNTLFKFVLQITIQCKTGLISMYSNY